MASVTPLGAKNSTPEQGPVTASKQRRSSTIYENSTRMAVNFLRTSSLALAEMTLGRGRGRLPAPERVDEATALRLEAVQPTVQSVQRHSVEPERHTTKCLRAGPNSATAITATVDESATEYIRRVRKRILEEH